MKIFTSFIDILKILNLKFTKYKYRKYLKTSNVNGGVTNVIGKDYTLRFDSAFEERKKEIQKQVAEIVKQKKNNPYKLISYIKKHNTKVYKLKNANKILSLINENEGFITPQKGLKALYLNIILNKKLSFCFEECFIMRDMVLDPYYTIHQFYSWFAYKSGFAGYEYEAQSKLKAIFNSKNKNDEICKLSISDIFAVKEAVRRDIEALDFVIALAKNTEGAKKAFNKMLSKTEPVNI